MLRTLVLLAAWLPIAAAPARGLTIDFAGDVTAVVDPGSRLDGSIAPGVRLTGRYVVDPTPTGAPEEVSSARLIFSVGAYGFDVSQAPHPITLVNDFPVGPALIDRWLPAAFVAAQLGPPIPLETDHAGFSARIEFTDATHARITGLETEPFVVLDAAPWSSTRLFFTSLVDAPGGGTALGTLQWEVAIDSWSAVPEPGSGTLLALGLVVLERARRRRF